ncbi:phosphatase PAP2 family protein [Pseudonocardia nantongensis]|uniref:phosphatase PAP2 family protein n=1 Tax=Pseudonocardia nantongensis TaxID=1181885 RepID=UPI00397D8A02
MVSLPDVPDASAQLLVDPLTWLGPLPVWAGDAARRGASTPRDARRVAAAASPRARRRGTSADEARHRAGRGGARLRSRRGRQAGAAGRPALPLLPSFPGWADCAAPGDWSLPSNHAAVAGALTVGVTLAACRQRRPGLLMIALVAGSCAAVSPVLAGAHFPHDVAVGAVLGGIVALVSLVATDLLAPRLPGRGPPGAGRDRSPERAMEPTGAGLPVELVHPPAGTGAGQPDHTGREDPMPPVEVEIPSGPASSVLEGLSRGAALLLVGHRGHGEVASRVIGPVGRNCVVHAQCTVVAVRS